MTLMHHIDQRVSGIGLLDRNRAGNHDPRLGRPPPVEVEFPFSTQEYARLLALRGRAERRALSELYAYYRCNQEVLAKILRGAPETFERLQGEFPQFFSDIGRLPGRWAATLAAGQKRRCRRGERLRAAALRLALHFETWRLLTGAEALTDEQAVELMAGLVGCPDDGRLRTGLTESGPQERLNQDLSGIWRLEAAGYLDRNLRSISVLVNRKPLQGAAGDERRIYFDLGHGYCGHESFVQCPHRLVCARCPLYEPKDSQRLVILEAEGNLIRLRQDLYLTEEEQAVIDGDVVAYRALRQRNWDVPTPAGPTPHQLATWQRW
jgi:hypothetical protein